MEPVIPGDGRASGKRPVVRPERKAQTQTETRQTQTETRQTQTETRRTETETEQKARRLQRLRALGK